MTEDVYTHGHHDSVLRSHRQRTAENSAAYLLPLLLPGVTVLDVGCGPGTITADFARLVAPGRVVGVDVAAEVVDEARIACAGLDNVELVVGDFRELDLGGPFDVVHAHQVLQHLKDPVGALRSMAALARPGGGVVAARDGIYSAFSWAPDEPRIDRWLATYFAVTRRNGAEADAGRFLLRWAQQAGLTDVTFSASVWTYATAELRAWWSDVWADRIGRVDGSALARQAVEYGIATAEELAAMAAGWRAWATNEDAVFVVPSGEILARV